MSYHHLINQIIQIERQEIELYRRLCEQAPTQCLRTLINRRIEHEKESIEYWNRLLNDCNYMSGNAYEADNKKKE